MSSHHIVREGQEPALIIANGEACNTDTLGQLLEWSPFVVVLDGAIQRVAELGIKIDVLLGDFDSHHPDVSSISHMPFERIHTPDQNKTDLQKAIEYLIMRKFDSANIIWATGRRADHTLTNITDIVRYKNQINLVMLDDYSRIIPLKSPFKKWYTQGSTISLMPVGEVHGIRTTGLKYNLDNESLTIGYRSGSSNEALTDGWVEISFDKGDLLLMECHD